MYDHTCILSSSFTVATVLCDFLQSLIFIVSTNNPNLAHGWVHVPKQTLQYHLLDPNLSSAMCKGYQEVHTDCNHLKRFVVIESCIYGLDEKGECLGNYFDVLYTRDIHFPSLCQDCYRREEANIFDRFDQEICRLGTMIAALRWHRRAEPAAAVRADMRAEMSRLEAEIGDARDERSEQLNEFRILQGFWADG